MKKLYNFRLDPTLMDQIDKMGGTRTSHITLSLQTYLGKHDTDTYSVNMSTMLLEENKKLKNENEFYHIQSLPFWKRRSYKKMLKQLPRGLS